MTSLEDCDEFSNSNQKLPSGDISSSGLNPLPVSSDFSQSDCVAFTPPTVMSSGSFSVELNLKFANLIIRDKDTMEYFYGNVEEACSK